MSPSPPTAAPEHAAGAWREAMIPLGLAAGAFALALLQRPGLIAADTKIDLHVDPVGFLGEAASVWSSSGGLGQVQAGQYAGYLFPMGPFFALGDLLGLAPWLVHRLWLGTLLALAAWGAIRLLDALLGGPRGPAHLIAGAFMVLNPYVVVFADRTSVTLLGYAALPWLLVCVHRGLRERRGWRWPAAFALVLTATGGGVNAAVTAWLLLGPLLLLVHEVAFAGAERRQALGLAGRTALLSVLASLWWLVPVAAHARYGLNFLPFTESPGAIWDTTSLSESFRLLGYWIGYLGTGFGERLVPYFDTAGTLLFEPAVIVASFLVPALALAAYAQAHRWRYGPYFLALTLLGLLTMSAGFPEGAPLRRALTFTYNELEAVQFLRTTYKAGPLVALGLACLLGAGAGWAWRRIGQRLVWRALAGVAVAAVLGLAALPLLAGRAVDRQIAFERIPDAWERAAAELERDLPRNARALVLPGQLLPFYRWGGTQDPVLPALSERPVAARGLVPFSDPHAADLLFTVDSLVQQRRLLPRQLPPLLRLMGVGAVITGTDDDRLRSGSVEPVVAAELLSQQPGLAGVDRSYGPRRGFAAAAGDLTGGRRLPQVRRYDAPGRLLRVAPRGAETVVDGSAEGLAALAALDALPQRQAVRYAGDAEPSELRRAAAAGSQLIVTDSNRRRAFLSSRVSQSAGPVLAASDDPPADAAFLNPFPQRGTEGQTVADLDGARFLDAPYSPNFPQFPEHRPYAALDGDRSTFWLADRYLERSRRWIEIGFERPMDVRHLDLLPQRETGTRVTEVEVAGRRHSVRPGWNRLELGLRGAAGLRVRVTGVEGLQGRGRGPGAIAELRVPGLRVRERLRPPRLLERALSSGDRSAAPTYVFTRTTGDDPLRRSRPPDPDRGLVEGSRNQEAALVAEPGDAERRIARTIHPPEAGSYAADGLALAAPEASDHLLDRVAGYRGGVRFDSSGRLQDLPSRRASSAFDGASQTAWVGISEGGAAPWIAWRRDRPATLSRLAIEPAGGRAGVPTSIRLRWPGGQLTRAVPSSGEVPLPRPVRSRSFRIEVLSARRPVGLTGPLSDAVGIAALRGRGVPRARIPRTGRIRARCGAAAVRVRATGRRPAARTPAAGSRPATAAAGLRLRSRPAAERLRLRPAGDVAALDAGRPLRALRCGEAAAVVPGPTTVGVEDGPFRIDVLRLRPRARASARRTAAGRVLDPGSSSPGSYEGARLDLDSPAWLILAESYNRGWRASCDGRSLGAPEVIDGFANGWRVGPDCRQASIRFGPNRAAWIGYWVSGVACLALLALVLVTWLRERRRRARGDERTLGELPASDERTLAEAPAWDDPVPPVGLAPRRAAIAGALIALPAAFVFSIRAGIVIGPLLALLLWRGLGPRSLSLAAAGLVGIALPAVQLVLLPPDRGGFNSEYALDLIAAHWIAVGAWTLLALALWHGLSRASRGRGDRAAARAGRAAPAARP